MSKSPRALRYSILADMPPGMRAAVEAQEKVRKAVVEAMGVPPQMLGADMAKGGDVHTVVKGVRRGDSVVVTEVEERRRSKYGAIVTYVDGIRFDSKREANYYSALKLRVAAGEVLYFLRQVPFHLPGGTKLVVDFLIAEADGRIRYVDVKGRQTPVFRLKKREVEHHYPVEIELA